MGTQSSHRRFGTTCRSAAAFVAAFLLLMNVACQPPADNGGNNGGSDNGGGDNGGGDNGVGDNGGSNNGGNAAAIGQLSEIVLDADGSLIGADVVNDQIVRVNRTTGAATLISGNGAGSGPELDSPNKVFLDQDGSLLVTTIKRLIFRIDAGTGNRTLLLDASDPNDPFPDSFSGIAATDDGSVYVTNFVSDQFIARVDSQAGELVTVNADNVTNGVNDIVPLGGNNVLVVDTFRRAVIQVALPGGDVTIISNVDTQAGPADTEVGTGPDFGQSPRTLAIASDGTIYEGDEANSSFGLGVSVVFAIDPDTGDRTVASGPDVGEGPEIGRPVDLIVDAEGLLVMIDANHADLLVIDPQTGDRSFLGSN
ncbi:MAG TPA: hypothetical protein PKN33_04825 [Phycisphaerae bacterium]|nr:hypothetical protein [Phycisphaerae bacterium]